MAIKRYAPVVPRTIIVAYSKPKTGVTTMLVIDKRYAFMYDLVGPVAELGPLGSFEEFVSVSSKNGTIVLASDNAYLYENLDKHLPIAQTFDASSNLAAQEHMKQLATSAHLIVPGHDPEVMMRYPKVGEDVVEIK